MSVYKICFGLGGNWRRAFSVSIPISYVPRSRPPRPITDIRPEDWKVFCAQSGVRKGFSSNIDVVQAFVSFAVCSLSFLTLRLVSTSELSNIPD